MAIETEGSESRLRSTILELCKDAAEGRLLLEDFHRRWPEGASQDPFFRAVYQDIENGVEHVPGFFLRPGIDYDSWRKSEMFFVLVVDSELLLRINETEELARCRDYVLSKKGLSKNTILQSINEYFFAGK